ncbi:MAG: hypothetical protein L0207_03645 [Chlamydiae bacterium]|nr:hypothetical protein [Chlamydiota bacterium]
MFSLRLFCLLVFPLFIFSLENSFLDEKINTFLADSGLNWVLQKTAADSRIFSVEDGLITDLFLIKKQIGKDETDFNKLIQERIKGGTTLESFHVLISEENLAMFEFKFPNKPNHQWSIYFYLPNTKEIYLTAYGMYGTANLENEEKKNYWIAALKNLYLSIKEDNTH